jgi:phosphate transport system permease protein
MTVLMATGNAQKTPYHIFDAVRTMTATIAIELGEVPFGSDHYHGLFVVGFILFVMTFAVNLIADLVLAKYQEVER